MTLPLPQWLRRDFGRKALALFFAILIWMAVTRRLQDTADFHGVPVRITTGPGIVVLNDRTPTVDVTVSGSKRRLQRLTVDDIHIEAKIDYLPPGLYFRNIRVTPENVRTPLGIKVVEIRPETVQVTVDRIESRPNVPVRVRFEGTPRKDYTVLRHTVVPPTVAVSGPSRTVRSVDEVSTEYVSLEGAVQSFQKDGVKLLVEEGLQVHPATVSVKVEIGRSGAEKAFDKLPLLVLCPPAYPLRVRGPLPTVGVTLHGPQAVLNGTDETKIRPFIDISNLTNPGTYRRPVRVWLAEPKASVQFVQPSMVEIELVPPSGETKASPAPE